jgi:integrase
MKRLDIAACMKQGNGRYSLGGNLSLVVRGGSALFEYQFRQDTKARTLVLGSAIGPAAMTVTGARDARLRALLARRDGVAVLGHRPTVVAGDAFEAAAASYLTNHSDEWSPRHRSGLTGLIRLYAGPLAALPVGRITTDNVADMLRPIWNGPGDNRGARLRRLVEAILTSKNVEPNPATWDRLKEKLSKKVATVTAKASMPYTDLPAFVATLGNGVEDRAMLFTILTAVRRKEALGAHWGEFDFVNRVWTVPASRMKMKLVHVVPLTDAMIACIGKPGDGLLFPAPRSGGVLPGEACSMKEHGYTLHGFRTTFATWAQAQDDGRAYPNAVIDAALAHKLEDKVAAAYLRHNHFAARVALMAAWASFVMGQ